MRQNRSDHKTTSTQKRERVENFSGLNPIFIQVHKQPLQEDRQNEKIIEERCKLGVDTGDRRMFRKFEEITEASCLSHFDPKKDPFITTDACIMGLGATRRFGRKKARFLDQ